MFKTVIRAAPRRILSSRTIVNANSRRCLSTAPPSRKSRSWKGSAARWGLAVGGIYFYNTSNIFAEEPDAAIQKLDESIHHIQESSQPTIDAIVEEKRQRQAQALAEEQRRQKAAEAGVAAGEGQGEEEEKGGEGLEGLEEEAGQQGAFNPETGEINWDCPCLGGMAHGPCGEEFKAAFSCFVYSNEEPKGVECIDKFKGMQDCFRAHPEMYGSELEDDEDDVEEELREREHVAGSGQEPASPAPEVAVAKSTPGPSETDQKPPQEPYRNALSAVADDKPKLGDEGGELVPKAALDAISK